MMPKALAALQSFPALPALQSTPALAARPSSTGTPLLTSPRRLKEALKVRVEKAAAKAAAAALAEAGGGGLVVGGVGGGDDEGRMAHEGRQGDRRATQGWAMPG